MIECLNIFYMRILLVSQFLSTTKGGGEYLFSEIANLLAKRGHQVWIITHRIEGEDYSGFHENVKIIFVSSIEYAGGLPPTFKQNMEFILKSMLIGLRLIRKEKIQVIHSNNFSPAFSSSILSSITSIPHITAIWDIFTLCGSHYWQEWARQENVSKIHAFLGPRFEKLIIKMKYKSIHTISKASEDDLKKIGVTKPVNVILPAIETTTPMNAQVNKNQFVYVGRLVFYKNIEIIIKAIPIIRKSFPDVKFVIIGGGPHKSYLEKLSRDLQVEENVSFRGYVSNDEKLSTISSSSFMVFPSLCEGFGLVILESFSQRRPVLVSDVRPLSDIIDDKKDGFVIASKDEKKWAELISHLIKNPHMALQMGMEGEKKLQTTYTQDSMMQNIETMYRQAID